MIRAALLLALLLPSLALGQSRVRTTLRTVPGSDVLADYQFATCGTTATGTRGEPVTCSRSTTATYECGGVLYTAPANTCRVDSSGGVTGLVSEPAGQNLLLRSRDIEGSPWSKDNGATAEALGLLSNGVKAVRIGNPGGAAALSQDVAVAASQGPFVASANVQSEGAASTQTVAGACGAVTASACSCWRSDGGVCTTVLGLGGTRCVAYATIPTTAVRLEARFTCASAITNPGIRLAGGQLFTSPGAGLFGGAQLEPSAVATSEIPTTGTAASRGADSISVGNPLAMKPSANWYVTTIAQRQLWNSLGYLWAAGAGGAANSGRSNFDPTGFYFTIFDSTGGATGKKEIARAVTYAAGSVHRMTSCNAAGVLTAYEDGTLSPVTQSGTGTGVISSHPATISLGSTSIGTTILNGKISRFTVGKGCRP